MGVSKYEIVNLRSVKVIGIWTDILQSNLLVPLIPQISLSLIINSETQKHTVFQEDTQNISLSPINMKPLFLKFQF